MRIVYNFLIVILLFSCSKELAVNWNKDYDISVMSFNLRYDNEEDGNNKWSNRKEACIKMIKETKPSVFGIQEGLSHQVEYLSENLNEYNYYGGGRDDGETRGEFNSIFYLKDKYEVQDSLLFWLSETPETPSYGWDAACRRVVTCLKLKDKVSKKICYIFNTHFDHEGEKAQKESAKLLIKRIEKFAELSKPIVITGDFNLLINNSSLKPIIDNYFSAKRFAEKSDNIDSFNFYGKWFLTWNIDFIFYNNLRALSYKTIADDYGVEYISDHYPIITHFKY
jgi:endonuclease/exonuclease/phosphatase family metal-dependent hydrolase